MRLHLHVGTGVAEGTVRLVTINKVDYMPFRGSALPHGLGASNLNGSLAVALISDAAALLCVIAPRFANETEPDVNTICMMDRLKAAGQEHLDNFHKFYARAVVVCGYSRAGVTATPSQLAYITKRLSTWNIPFVTVGYYIRETDNEDAGTVVIDCRDIPPGVYVEGVFKG